ncbi:ATP-binding protein [Streptomyces sp. NPDC088762]|uniref:ATP-binding protein n=1 Tax=Streptomyces sp. NPDC088762 TaxID=3365891 RepID=UPI0037FAF444
MTGPAQIVAELASNAVTHGRVPGRDFRLALSVTPESLLIEVTDPRGDRIPEIREAGYGLVLVEALANRWGVREGPVPCKAVWAEVSLASASRGAAIRRAQGAS